MTNRLFILFKNQNDLVSGERLLRKTTKAPILKMGQRITYQGDCPNTLFVRNVRELGAWLRSAKNRMPKSFLLALTEEFEVYRQSLEGLASMNVRPSQLLSIGQDQIMVLDREQRIVAFFGHWPKESPRRLKDVLGKRKRDIFGPETAAIHEAAVLRGLKGEEAAYDWTITDSPQPVSLFTTASPLTNDEGEIVGVVLVTRNVMALKQAQMNLEKALKEKTHQLREIENGARRIAAAFQGFSRPESEHRTGAGLHTRAFLSRREQAVLDLLRTGVRSRFIAQTLGISVETVRRHVKSMFRKTGVHSQDALVKLFSEMGESS